MGLKHGTMLALHLVPRSPQARAFDHSALFHARRVHKRSRSATRRRGDVAVGVGTAMGQDLDLWQIVEGARMGVGVLPHDPLRTSSIPSQAPPLFSPQPSLSPPFRHHGPCQSIAGTARTWPWPRPLQWLTHAVRRRSAALSHPTYEKSRRCEQWRRARRASVHLGALR